jgi:Glycosyl hydrolase family 26
MAHYARDSAPPRRRLGRGPIAAALAAVLLAAAVSTFLVSSGSKSGAGADKQVCVYSSHKLSVLKTFSHLAGRVINCALVFNDASPNWQAWTQPWFLFHPPNPDLNWAGWLRSAPPDQPRRLIITQNLFPSALNKTDWLDPGARGAFTGYAKALARNLVRAGAGNSIIRLAHEANGDWYPDSVGATDAEMAKWREFWRRTVLAMKSVPGANFKFDWTVNAGYRPIPLAKFYPGDDVVDIIGADTYDVGVPAGQGNRWRSVYNRPGGLRSVVLFAREHRKPLSIPEWGVTPPNAKPPGGGDDPAFVDGIAGVVRSNPVAYQAYFFSAQYMGQLQGGARSLAAFKRHFGPSGDSAPKP